MLYKQSLKPFRVLHQRWRIWIRINPAMIVVATGDVYNTQTHTDHSVGRPEDQFERQTEHQWSGLSLHPQGWQSCTATSTCLIFEI